MRKEIGFLLDEQSDFQSLVSKLEKIFNISFKIINHDGRLIAYSNNEHYEIKLIDKYDDLSPILCDEYYSLDFSLSFLENSSYEEEEAKLTEILDSNGIVWIKGVWGLESLDKPPRIIFP